MRVKKEKYILKKTLALREKVKEKKRGKDATTTKENKDLVFLKDPKQFFDHIIAERGLDREKVLIRIGLDGGQGSFKVIVSIFETDYDPDITFSEKEGPGNRLTGSSRMLVMALCDDLQVNNFGCLISNLGVYKFEIYFRRPMKI